MGVPLRSSLVNVRGLLPNSDESIHVNGNSLAPKYLGNILPRVAVVDVFISSAQREAIKATLFL